MREFDDLQYFFLLETQVPVILSVFIPLCLMVSEREGRSPVIGLLSHNAPFLRVRLQFDMFGLGNYCLGQPHIPFERGQSGKSERAAKSEGVENRRAGAPGPIG